MKTYSVKEIQAVLDQAAICGMTHEAMQFPITLPQPEDQAEIRRQLPANAALSRPDYAKLMQGLSYPGMKLETLFWPGVFLKDRDHDGLADFLDFQYVFPRQVDRGILQAAADLTCRFAMDSTSIETDHLIGKAGGKGNQIRFTGTGRPAAVWQAHKNRTILLISGKGAPLARFMALFCRRFDSDQMAFPLDELTWQMRRAFAGKSYDGQQAFIAVHGAKPIYYTDLPAGERSGFGRQYQIVRWKDAKPTATQNFRGYSETAQLLAYIQQLKTAPQEASQLCIEAAVSKDRRVRQQLERQIQKVCPGASVRVLNAYKPGFSWLEEVCLPQLQKQRPDQIIIRVRPYLKPGETQWHDEAGAVPKRGSDTVENQQEKWLELPIRFLQELYPIDDLLARQLGLAKTAIVFQMMDQPGEETYELTAMKDGQCCYRNTYRVRTAERLYLDAYPQAGIVHPDCAYVSVSAGQKILLAQQFATDRDWLWTQFQTKTLPLVRQLILASHPKGIKPADQPFFARLNLDITLSETERRLPSRQDIIAPIDALQEDLYFTTLEYFKYFGREVAGAVLDAPGLIVPAIHNRPGAPHAKVSYCLPRHAKAEAVIDGRPVSMDVSGRQPTALTQVSARGDSLVLHYDTQGMPAAYLRAFASLLESGRLRLSASMPAQTILRFGPAAADAAKLPAVSRSRLIQTVDLAEKSVIDDSMMKRIARDLSHVKGVRVVPLAESYLGRIVYGLIPEGKPQAGYVSRVKRITRHPSVVIDCRHHANEVSSTNSSLRLLRQLLVNPRDRGIADQLNLIIIPMENPDGSWIHHVLAREHPVNKLHVARYDALGSEFAHHTFCQDTIHTEAHAGMRVFRSFLPDVFVDDHGVPSHEWEQPYSGYTSPAFKGFWLPRSILYGYFWYCPEPQYEQNQAICHAMARQVADAIAASPVMRRHNREWMECFEKYAHAWMPKLFPADYEYGMIDYWIVKPQEEHNLYLSQRWPWITTAYYTSEVADETAQGRYLQLCADTHLRQDLAILRLLRQAQTRYNTVYVLTPKGLHIGAVRQRPVLPAEPKHQKSSL